MQNIYLKSFLLGSFICYGLAFITSFLFKENVDISLMSIIFGIGVVELVIDVIHTYKLKSIDDDFLKNDVVRKLYNSTLNSHIIMDIVIFVLVYVVLFILSCFVYKISFFNITHFATFMMSYFYLYVILCKTEVSNIEYNIRCAIKELYGNEEENNNYNEE